MTTTGVVTSERVIIEADPDEGGWLLMWDDGQIERRSYAQDALHAVRTRAQGIATRTHGAVVTEVEWRNVPEGFTPPGTPKEVTS